jgi:hypothetical protein
MRVFLGGSHDGGYTTTLNVLENEGLINKIAILRGYAELARELDRLKLPVADIDGLFLLEKLAWRHKKATVTSSFTSHNDIFPRSRSPSKQRAATRSSSPEKPTRIQGTRYLDPTIVCPPKIHGRAT